MVNILLILLILINSNFIRFRKSDNLKSLDSINNWISSKVLIRKLKSKYNGLFNFCSIKVTIIQILKILLSNCIFCLYK